MNAAWPGVRMNQAKGAIYSLAIGAEFDKVIFNDGSSNQTADLDLANATPYWNGDSWEAAPDVSAETEYYLVGTFNEWTTGSTCKLTAATGTVNTNFNYTFKIENVALLAGAELKVVSSENEWFAEASKENGAANFTIGEAGNYDFFFNPAKGDGTNYIFCQAHA